LGRLEQHQSEAKVTILADQTSVKLFYPRSSRITVFTTEEVRLEPQSTTTVTIRSAVPLKCVIMFFNLQLLFGI
jgi:hypothetical protein